MPQKVDIPLNNLTWNQYYCSSTRMVLALNKPGRINIKQRYHIIFKRKQNRNLLIDKTAEIIMNESNYIIYFKIELCDYVLKKQI